MELSPPPDVPRLEPGVRLVGRPRIRFRHRVVTAYHQQYSARRIAAAAGRSERLIHQLLTEARVKLRSTVRTDEPADPVAAAREQAKGHIPYGYQPLMVDMATIKVRDLVHVHGAWRRVQNLRAVGLSGKVLMLEGGVTYRLPRGTELDARRPITSR